MNASDVETIDGVARDALKRFARALLATCGPIGAGNFAHDKARDGAIEVAGITEQILGHDLVGEVVSHLDTKGLNIEGVHVTTNLAAFAQGRAASPIDSVFVDNVKEIFLPSLDTHLGAIETSCTLTLRLTCGRRDDKRQVVMTTTKIALDIEYSSPAHELPSGKM